jgi:Low-density lipoprotein receptor repeat class B/PEP-CTERM motif
MRVLHSIIVIVLALGWASSSSGLDLYWNDGSGIHRFRSSNPLGSPTLFATYETRGMVVDPANAQLWWSDKLPLGCMCPAGVIRTGSTTGGAFAHVVTHLTSPAGVALDARRGRIYWSDLGDVNNASAIFSANLDGSDVQKLVSGVFISEIAGIALDPIHDKLYFTYINPLIDSLLTGGIARADLDGSNLELIVGGQGKPIGISVDAAGGGIYWADAMSISPAGGNGAIKSADLDGQYQRTILGGLSVPYGVALEIAEQNVYWTDMGTGKIQRTVMSGSLPYFQDVLTGLASPTAIVIVPTLPGDYNQNGTVDAADYVMWRKNPDAFGGDPAGYDTWRAQFGQTAGSGAEFNPNVAVPEPSTLLMLVAGILTMRFRQRASVSKLMYA